MGIRNFFKKQVNYKKWCDADGMKQSTSIVKNICKSFARNHKYQPPAPTYKTFEACMNHYQLTDEDLQKQKQFSLKLVYLYIGCSMGLFLYTFVQFWMSHLLGGLMTIVLSALLFLYGLKEYTKIYQIKHRVLKFKLIDCLKELILYKE